MTFEIPVPHPDSGISSLGLRFEKWKKPQIIHTPSEPSSTPVFSISRMVGDLYDDVEDLSGLYVKAVTPGTPADSGPLQTSVLAGDRLLAVNGYSVVGLALEVS